VKRIEKMIGRAKLEAKVGESLNRKLRVVLIAAVLAGTAVLTYAGGQVLFFPGPPMLARAARAATIFLVAATYLLVLVAVARGIQRVPKHWPGVVKIASIVAVVASGAAVLPFASLIAFFIVHAVCYAAQACAVFSFLEGILHTINVATRYTVVESLLVLPVVVGLATTAYWTKRPVPLAENEVQAAHSPAISHHEMR